MSLARQTNRQQLLRIVAMAGVVLCLGIMVFAVIGGPG